MTLDPELLQALKEMKNVMSYEVMARKLEVSVNTLRSWMIKHKGIQMGYAVLLRQRIASLRTLGMLTTTHQESTNAADITLFNYAQDIMSRRPL